MRSSRINIEGEPIFRHHKNIFLYTYLSFVVLLAAGCSEHANGPIPETKIQIPKDSDWIDEGTVLEKGDFGSWEVRLEGAISPGTMVKKNGAYFSIISGRMVTALQIKVRGTGHWVWQPAWTGFIL